MIATIAIFAGVQLIWNGSRTLVAKLNSAQPAPAAAITVANPSKPAN
ncbi:MAG TPA: hypothetical protein VFP96_17530 [Candidatus Acidoferrum sp.]|nr:hypothetical protein [Candidatus Acidoferrum sp.]